MARINKAEATTMSESPLVISGSDRVQSLGRLIKLYPSCSSVRTPWQPQHAAVFTVNTPNSHGWEAAFSRG